MSSLIDFQSPEGCAVIPLTKGKFAIVDERDFEWLNQWKWHFTPGTVRSGGYARRVWLPEGKYGPRISIAMHRQIYAHHNGINYENLSPKDEIDHENRDGLDNRYSNLRLSNRTQNVANSAPRSHNSSGYKGIKFCKTTQKWVAQATKDGKRVSLGYYATSEEAAKVYNDFAKEVYGEFAFLNAVPDDLTPVRISNAKGTIFNPFKGVSFHKRTGKWMAYAKLPDGKRKHIGYYKTEEDALIAYENFTTQMAYSA